jgi:hypothetical protein
VWLQGALPIGVANGLINGLLAWSSYRFGVTSAVVSSESGGAVIIVSILAWFLGHQWGRADLAGGRAEVRAAHALPPKVRLGPQGAVVAVVIELIALGVVAHALGHPPSPLIASCFRGIGAGLAGAVVFGLAAVAGALGAEADERESVLPQAEEAPS